MKLKIMSLAILALLITSCGKNTMPPDSFFEEGGKVMLVWNGPDFGKFTRVGGQGIIDYAINETIGDAIAKGYIGAIERVEVKPLVEEDFMTPYGESLENFNYTVNASLLPIDTSALDTHSTGNDKTFSKIDFSSFKEQYDADYVVQLEVKYFGLQRRYYGMVPTSKPYGVTTLSVILINTQNNEILSKFSTTVKGEEIKDWNDKAEYTKLINSAKKTFKDAMELAYSGFFPGE